MKSVANLIVFIVLDEKKIEVGELINDGRKIHFKYHPNFIKTNIQISPFKLPLSSNVLTVDTNIFEGLFGVFNDSLPDGWGRLLLDRALTSKGISLTQINVLDRLSFVGNNGKGALVYAPAKDSVIGFEKQLELNAIAQESQKILEGSSSDIIEELVQLGGSSGGARPKIHIGYHPEKDHLIHGKEHLPDGYEHWIIKFPTSSDPKDIAQIEYAYHKMALDAGLDMSNCRLFEDTFGNQYFGTKRFDRNGNKRLHLHSASGMLHDNFRLSSMDYGHLMDAAFRLENDVNAYEKILRLAAFNVFAHNRDDHSKNVSFLMNTKGEWQLAPAYDLTFSMSAHGFHSTTVAGEGKSPNHQHLMELASVFDVKNITDIIEQVKHVIHCWKTYAKEYGVSKLSTKMIAEVLEGM